MGDGRSTSRLSICWIATIPLTSSHDLNMIPVQTCLDFERFRHKDFHDFPRLAFGCSSRLTLQPSMVAIRHRACGRLPKLVPRLVLDPHLLSRRMAKLDCVHSEPKCPSVVTAWLVSFSFQSDLDRIGTK